MSGGYTSSQIADVLSKVADRIQNGPKVGDLREMARDKDLCKIMASILNGDLR